MASATPETAALARVRFELARAGPRAQHARMRARVAGLVVVLSAACGHGQHAPDPSPFAVALPVAARPGEPPGFEVPLAGRTSERNRCIDRALAERKLNEFGDPGGTVYPTGMPPGVSKGTDRYDHVMRHRPDVAIECSAAPGEPRR